MTVYQESASSSFSHNGRKFNLNKIFASVKDREVSDIELSQVISVLDRATIVLPDGSVVCKSCHLRQKETHPERVNNSDLNVPILVTLWDNKVIVIDGAHRVEKAKLQGAAKIRAKWVSESDLLRAQVAI